MRIYAHTEHIVFSRDAQPSAQREGDVLMSLEAVLEVINEDIGDLRASSPADYDEYNGEQTEPLGWISFQNLKQ